MIKIKNLSKSFFTPQKIHVLDDISLSVKDGEFVTIFGPNGCGKTTMLYILAGVEKPTGGHVLINGRRVEDSRAGFIFQNYNDTLLPWRTVQGNIEFALEARGMAKAERKKISEDLLSKFGLHDFRDKYPYNLSGGMKQMAAIIRTLAYDPEFFLMDEPFGSLDYINRLKMGEEIQRIWMETGKTVIFVSHDIDEAIFLADRVVVLSNRPAKIKEIVKVGLPRPRKFDMLNSSKFISTRKKVLKIFKSETYEID